MTSFPFQMVMVHLVEVPLPSPTFLSLHPQEAVPLPPLEAPSHKDCCGSQKDCFVKQHQNWKRRSDCIQTGHNPRIHHPDSASYEMLT
mmetsp:Transcript_12939/g.36657  ORF Transcript_12939/g.36657 Transcript_12939/m.36657 type:complete len:88 (-) Transcript_12939:22-285(-)